MNEDKVYAGETRDIIRALEAAAKTMVECQIKEVQFQLAFSKAITEIRLVR